IFAINELPDLAPRIQVALLNILEERDLQIRGFPVRIPMDIMLVFSANPEDYTSRGNIITPLKDRIDSQVLTHYPRDVATARRITEQESWVERDDQTIELPEMVRDLVEKIAFGARESELVDQSSGVSARMPISAIELLMSNLERRGARSGDTVLYPRLSDFLMLVPAITGKVEMVYEGEQQGAEVVAQSLIGSAIRELFESIFPAIDRSGSRERRRRMADDEDVDSMFRRVNSREEPADEEDADSVWEEVLSWFAEGNSIMVSDELPFEQYQRELSKVKGLEEIVLAHATPAGPGEKAFLMELALEGLHQSLRLAREDIDSTITFSELAKFNVLRTVR
ncbi:MAG: hypothetical protein KY432_09210, partial [Acidobacteria bacterium]|nr:hypothetical protein [Acidobacteriota bacterium]